MTARTKNIVKWSVLAIAAILVYVAARKSGLLARIGLDPNGDAPGVKPGDVSYSRYKKTWTAARAHARENFTLAGVNNWDESGDTGPVRVYYIYTWQASNGELVETRKQSASLPRLRDPIYK